ncbi:MAG: 50S ribosomal protein L4 [Limnochordales bacterium]|nr:50S ribosomal protein L4 [Bacillota bacterium]
MPKVAVYNLEGQTVGEIELSDVVFGAPVNEALLHQAVVTYLANQRQGTASTKTRGEVRGGGRKPWRQKGTGRARQGSIRAPHWVGGGVVFGPKPREYRLAMPKKARRAALRSALSAKVREGNLIVLESLVLPEPKTKLMAGVLRRLSAERKPLILLAERNRNVELSTRNLPGAATMQATDVNVYAVLSHEKLVLTKDAVAKLEEALG